MDPAKRICLKNLPEDCTKREIAELIKARTGAQPHSIDLGLDSAGRVRRYAHFSCEGVKKVLEVIGSGVVLRDTVVQAHPAKMHYSFRYAEARRKREREEEEEQKALEAFWVSQRERFLARTNNGELPPKEKPPRDFYFSRRKYGTIASEIAEKLRKAHKDGGAAADNGTAAAAAAAAEGAPPRPGRHQTRSQRFQQPHPQVDVYAPLQEPQRYPKPPPAPVPVVEAAAESVEAEGVSRAGAPPPGKHARRERVPLKKHRKEKVEKKATPPPPPPPPQPSKEERKLTGLQAKLAALKEKMSKK